MPEQLVVPPAPAAVQPDGPTSLAPTRKVISGLVSDLIMTVISHLAIRWWGHDLDPAMASTISMLVGAAVGLAVSYIVPEKAA